MSVSEALARMPERSFGENEWVTIALETSVRHLETAIATGIPYRIANAIRAIAHTPSAEQVDDIVTSVCDTLLSDAYANRNSRMITNVANARAIVADVLADVAGAQARTVIEPPLMRELVDGYVRLAELFDKRLGERLDAVGSLASRIASAMHLPADTILAAEFGGRLHDVGMLSLPARRGIKVHSVVGASFLESLPALAHLAPIVRSHHERYDGTGFPDGLRGDDIPLEARIIAIASIFVELVTESPRHEPLLPNDACFEIARHSGTRFDPAIVTATLDLLHYRQRTNRTA